MEEAGGGCFGGVEPSTRERMKLSISKSTLELCHTPENPACGSNQTCGQRFPYVQSVQNTLSENTECHGKILVMSKRKRTPKWVCGTSPEIKVWTIIKTGKFAKTG